MNSSNTRAPIGGTPSLTVSVGERVDFDRDTEPGFRIHETEKPAQQAEKKARRARKQAQRALALLDHPQARVQTVVRRVSREVERRPLFSLLVGFGVGFAIGGALSTRLGRMALVTAGRYAMKELISGG